MSVNTGESIGGRRGAALAVVMFFTLVMSILASALYALYRSNVNSYIYTRNGNAAGYCAEAGARLAVHHLSENTFFPTATRPSFLPGATQEGRIDLPWENGSALVVIDPRNNVENVNAIRGVQIRSRGFYLDAGSDVSVTYAPDYPSRYALLVDREIPPGFFTDGTVVDGPVHCNGDIHFGSVTPDSSDDPFVAEVSTTPLGGFVFSDAGRSGVPHPPGSRTWVRPYTRHRGGAPSWNPSAPVVDFRRLGNYFAGLGMTAHGMGTFIVGAKRIILDGNTMKIKTAETGPVSVLELGRDKNLVFVANGAMPVYIKSGRPTTIPLTIVTTGNVYISGNIYGETAGNSGPLALVSLGDIVVASDPSYSGEHDWSAPWDIQTEGNLEVRAYLAAPSGVLRSQSVLYPGIPVHMVLAGGLLEKRMGRLGTAMSGYRLVIRYDNGLGRVMPPHFPILENWIMMSWTEDPDYGGRSIQDDMY